MSHAVSPCFKGFALRFCKIDAARAGALVFGLGQKPYAHQGWRTLLLFVLFGCCSVLFFCVRWGRCRSGAADPMKALGFARPYESLGFCSNSSGAKSVQAICLFVLLFFVVLLDLVLKGLRVVFATQQNVLENAPRNFTLF